MKVSHLKGVSEDTELQRTLVEYFEGNSHIVASEWRLNEELVRRDVMINILCGLNIQSEQKLG